jgi:SAM-dependent methyltransferase
MDLITDPRRHFDELFAASADPWQFKQRWYESRKRALTLACLPRPRYASGYEPGCANGELSAALAERCDRLLISDGAAAAVKLAQERMASLPQVSAVQAWVPDEWPQARFDLIVISELAYYLDADALAALATKARASLAPGGDIVACHWRHPIAGCRLDGDAVHAALSQALGLPCVWLLADPDFRLEVWSADARSVGTREALVSG